MYSNFDKNLFAVGVSLWTACVVVFLLACIVTHKYNVYKSNHLTSKLFFCFGILGSLSYAISAGFGGSRFFGRIGVLGMDDQMVNVLHCFDALFWHFGQINCYLYFLYRLYIGFQGTQHVISKKTLIISLILILIYFIFDLMFIGFIIWSHIESNIWDKDTYKILFDITFFVHTSIDLVLSLSLLILFVIKLKKVGESLYSSDNIQFIRDGSIDGFKDNIFEIISKVNILGTIMIVTSQILLISLVVWSSIEINGTAPDELFLFITWMYALHVFIAPVCLLFGFDFTKKWYKFCCNCCHKKMKKYSIDIMDKKMEQHMRYEML